VSKTSILNTPVLWVNAYLQEKLEGLGFETMPFFPSVPSTLNDLTEFFPTSGVMATYDRMIRMREVLFHISNVNNCYFTFMLQPKTQ